MDSLKTSIINLFGKSTYCDLDKSNSKNTIASENFDVKQSYITYIKDSNMTEEQKEKLMYYTDNINIIEKEYKIYDDGYMYYIKLDIGWNVMSYKYSFHKNKSYEEIDSKFNMFGLTICNNNNIYELILDSKMPNLDLHKPRLIESFLGCRLFKEVIDFTNKIIQLDNIPKESLIMFDGLEFYRKSLFHIKPLVIPPRLKKFIKNDDIDIVIDDGTNFDLDKSFLHQNVKYHYILTSEHYDFKFMDNNTKLGIYLIQDDMEPYCVIKLKQNEIDSFAKFF